MKKILFLTKNILVDQEFQNELQLLNFEVFCSSNLLEKVLENAPLVDFFECYDIVLLSDTISDKEMHLLLENIRPYSLPVIRKDASLPNKEEMQEWSTRGLKGWIHSEMTKSEVRELINSFESLENGGQNSFQRRPLKIQVIPNFSRLERSLVDILCEHPKQIVSRNEICQKLWESNTTNSNLSHLSFLISKLKSKFEQMGFEKECIGTIWGKGYQIDQEIQEWWSTKVKVNS
ncbi:winged helix-turn-helix domain-containing protein [Enterococcus sp. DIV0756]|uniref:winged helix-turn-helix domain-containing protein n=1 Tax=Enterococcus sp. DIV0756 TaxID=2774636 RepID=UPI003F27826C